MNRLPFGIKSATGIFQQDIEKILGNEDGVILFLDDIVVAADNMVSHN